MGWVGGVGGSNLGAMGLGESLGSFWRESPEYAHWKPSVCRLRREVSCRLLTGARQSGISPQD